MSGPAYHLRVNKAADRFALIEAIRGLRKLGEDLQHFTYFGFGGPYLEDMRLIYEFFPDISMFSIEQYSSVCERQNFHLPCAMVHIENCDMSTYVRGDELEDNKSIVWLDYTNLEFSDFLDFQVVIGKVAPKSIVKITLRADPRDYWVFPKNQPGRHYVKEKDTRKFREKFESIMPDPAASLPWKFEDFALLIQKMLQISAQQALEGSTVVFHPISSFYYSDGTWMFTLTGIIAPRDDEVKIKEIYDNWELANTNWTKPRLIDIPNLSTKERLHLQYSLPCEGNRGEILCRALGHLIHEEDDGTTEASLEQYAAFHRYFPYFLRGIP